MRTVVIGATGHIGSWLVPRLVCEGHEVVAVSRGARRPYRESPEWRSVERVKLDRTAAEHEGSFGPADDVAQGFGRVLSHRAAAIGEAFHIAAAEPVTMRGYAEAVAAWFGREANLDFLPWEEWRLTVSERDAAITRDHILHSPHASIHKARSVLGFEPRYSAVAAAREAAFPGLRRACE